MGTFIIMPARERKAPEKLEYDVPKTPVKKKKVAVKKVVEKKTAAKKGKKEKKEKKGYKNGLSAFMFYCKDERPKLVKAHSDWAFGAFGKALGEQWGKCAAKDKVKYEKLAAKDKERAAKDKAAWEKKTKK